MSLPCASPRRSTALACTLFTLATLAGAQGPPARKPYLSRCGSQIAWETEFDRALERADAEGKPIFWFVSSTLNTPMDRRQELYWLERGGLLNDPALTALLEDSFIPLDLGFAPLIGRRGRIEGTSGLVGQRDRSALAETYGLIAPKMIEPGFVLLDTEGQLVHTVDRLGTHESRWFMQRMKRIFAEHGARLFGDGEEPELRSLVDGAPEALKDAHALLWMGKLEDAAQRFEKAAANAELDAELNARARYFAGACAHLRGENAKGDAIWKKLIETSPDQPWSWKAQLELERWGPFLRGFETYLRLPETAYESEELRTSLVPAGLAPRDELVKPALDFLLRMPREDGLWIDSRYDFGGLDSLPNVHVAVSALSALALLEWREMDPRAIDPVIEEVRTALLDETRIASEDQDEIVWAHALRLLYFAREAQVLPQYAASAKEKAAAIVASLFADQLDSGGWRHEYAAAFTSAFVIHAIRTAEALGLELDEKALDRAGAAIEKVRGDGGTWPYSFGRPSRTPVASACRAPWCELALLHTGRSTEARLSESLALAWKHHDLLAGVRRYDDHADRYGHGGFFFWFDILGRSAATARLGDRSRLVLQHRTAKMIAALREADGTWLDSHEVGKVYGTAAALVLLSRNL